MPSQTRLALLLSACLLPLGAGAQAQSDPVSHAPSAPAEADEQGSLIGDIVVTAQRREQRLRDVPASITAVTAAGLENAGVTTTRDLQLVTPGLRIDAVGVYVQPSVRGVSTTLTRGEANVATYIDGVYQAALVSAVYSLPDVRQIEVLKGPQGTLFGRNATGGAILINTIDPDLDEASERLTAGVGNFGSATFKGYASTPIIDGGLAIGVSGIYDDTSGWKRNLALGGRRKGADFRDQLVRVKLRAAPFDGADIVVTGIYSKRVDHSALRGTPLSGNTIAAAYLAENGLPQPSRPWEFAIDTNAVNEVRTKSVNVRGAFDIGPGTFKTTTTYTDLETLSISDADLSVKQNGFNVFHDNLESFSQEFLYSTDKVGRFSGVIGAFFFKSSGGYEPFYATALPSNTSTVIWTHDKAKSFSVFGEINFEITDSLTLTGGLRYNRETRKADAGRGISFTRPDPIPFLGEKTWNSTTPRLALLYKASDAINLYATFSKGFKSGVFNGSALQAAPVNPEKITAFEAGVKGDLSSQFNFSLAGFHYDYTDLQVPTITTVGVQLIQTLTNAATARIHGAEATAGWRPNDRLNLTAGATYLHARYRNFASASANIPTGLGGNRTVSVDASGFFLPRSPTWTANLTGSYSQPTAVGEFEVSGSIYYSSRVFFDSINRVNQSPYATINAALAWRPDDSGVQFRLWGRNLTNRAVMSAPTITGAYDSIEYLPPRQYGVEASLSF